MNALQRAIEYCQGQRHLAEALGVTSMAITQWKRRGVPIKRAVDIESATEGAVTRQELRPDIFGTLQSKDGRAA